MKGPGAMIGKKVMYGCLNAGAVLLLLQVSVEKPAAQDEATSRFRVNVVLVELNVAVTDNKGNYITGLHPEDFAITEDNIPEKLSNFEEGDESIRNSTAPDPTGAPADRVVVPTEVKTSAPQLPPPVHTLAGSTLPGFGGASVFVLFDTSNYMYRSFVFAQDAIADFVRTMPDASKIAFYSYSRDLSRAGHAYGGSPLPPPLAAAAAAARCFKVVSGVRSTVAGDDAALYNSLLLTVKLMPLRWKEAQGDRGVFKRT